MLRFCFGSRLFFFNYLFWHPFFSWEYFLDKKKYTDDAFLGSANVGQFNGFGK